MTKLSRTNERECERLCEEIATLRAELKRIHNERLAVPVFLQPSEPCYLDIDYFDIPTAEECEKVD